MYWQGDVGFVIATIPTKAERTERTVLAEGEATGHHHSLATRAGVEVYELGPHIYLRVGGDGVAIEHQEHHPISLPAGDYRVIRQVEYQHGEARRVAD